MTDRIATQRLYLDAARQVVVGHGDARAAFLLAGVGQTIPADAPEIPVTLLSNDIPTSEVDVEPAEAASDELDPAGDQDPPDDQEKPEPAADVVAPEKPERARGRGRSKEQQPEGD